MMLMKKKKQKKKKRKRGILGIYKINSNRSPKGDAPLSYV